MSAKALCPACDSYTSDLFTAFQEGQPCPHCNLPAEAAPAVTRGPVLSPIAVTCPHYPQCDTWVEVGVATITNGVVQDTRITWDDLGTHLRDTHTSPVRETP